MILRAIFALVTCFLSSCFEAASPGLSRKEGSITAVKTIKTEHGDMYDCVDFYKQPTFSHPLLKNHTYHPQMRPTSRPKWIENNNISLTTNMIRLKDGGCPPGTIPIRRVNGKDDLSRTKVLSHHFAEKGNLKPNHGTEYISGTVYALGQTKSNPWKKYYGVGGVLSIYNPRALPSQYSSGEIILRGGGDSIIAGWTVNPSKYADDRTRFFIYAVAGDLHCFNSECGFVIVRSDIPLDFLLHPGSKKGEQVYINKFFVYQEKISGDWWLEVGMNPPIALGFWPQRIFEGLKGSATYAACGGEINSIATMPPPQMGSGSYPVFAADMMNDAFCKKFVVVDETYTIVDAADSEAYGNNPDYGVIDFHMKNHQHVVTFGGP